MSDNSGHFAFEVCGKTITLDLKIEKGLIDEKKDEFCSIEDFKIDVEEMI